MKNNHTLKVKRNSIERRNDFVSIIILSENYGYRMKSYGSMSLLKIADKSLIEKQLKVIKSFFINYEVILCCGFETKKTVDFVKDKFANENIRIVENQIYSNSNSCESARLCLNNLMNDKVLIIHGDLVLSAAMLSQIDYKNNSILVQDDNRHKNFIVSAIDHENQLNNFCIGGKNKFWTDCVYLNDGGSINKLSEIVNNPNYKNKFLFEALNELVRTTKIKTCVNELNPVLKINNIKSLKDYMQNEDFNTKLY
jgi:hypothetical protein